MQAQLKLIDLAISDATEPISVVVSTPSGMKVVRKVLNFFSIFVHYCLSVGSPTVLIFILFKSLLLISASERWQHHKSMCNASIFLGLV
jgi:hypothetical protein